MSMTMEDDIKRWTAKRKEALLMEIIQDKTTISQGDGAVSVEERQRLGVYKPQYT